MSLSEQSEAKCSASDNSGFNPCFSGCPSQRNFRSRISLCFGGFNPCFSGCPSQRRCLGPGRKPKNSGFNPCFSGCPSQRGNSAKADQAQGLVSILVLVDVPLRGCLSSSFSRSFRVSILVLVDVPLRAFSSPPFSFPLRVSILVLVDVLLRG